MASDWQPSKLGDVIAVNPSRPLVKGSDSVYISMQQVETANRSVNKIDHRAFKGSGARFQNGDTLLARITPCLENGKTAYVDFLDDEEVGHGSTEFIVLSGIEGVSDDLFVYYLARFPEFRNFAIIRMEGSSGRQRVPAPTLKKYVFACPSYDEQRAIAHILGSLDDKIELNRRMNQTLEAMARAIFKSWFVDFLPVRAKQRARTQTGDPVRAKAEGRPTGLPDEIAALFPDSFEDSELGEIPKGWGVKNLNEIANIIDCLHSKKPERQTEGRLLIQVFNVGDTGRLDFSNPYYISPNEYNIWIKRMEVQPGDIVITKTGRVGAVGQMPNGYKAAMGRNIVGIRATNGMSLPSFLKDLLLSDHIRTEIIRNTNDGTILQSLHVKAVNKLRVILPQYALVQAYNNFIKPIHTQLEINDEESRTLASLRDTLLPKLISGELRVPEAEKFVEEAGL